MIWIRRNVYDRVIQSETPFTVEMVNSRLQSGQLEKTYKKIFDRN
jgi:hypothetical protein